MRRSLRLAGGAAAADDDINDAVFAATAAAEAGAGAAAAGQDEEDVTISSKGEALLAYQSELRRRLGLGPVPVPATASSSAIPTADDEGAGPTPTPGPKRRRGLDGLLLLGRAGGSLPLRGPRTPSRLEVMASIGCHRLPDSPAGTLAHYPASLFSCVFSRSGAMVSVACQDGTISLYDTQQLLYRQATEAAAADKRSAHYRGAGPPPPLRPRKQIECQDVGWSIIGSAFSPDGRWIAYSSWSRYLHLANTWGQHCLHEPYLVSASRSRHFCLFTLAFSSDGTRVVGGGNDGGVHVVHLEQKTHTAVERAHFDDVNAVCFLHPDADALLVSGSDDGLVKLWDLRSPDRARGLCVGHTHGVASVASKGNGVHVVSNGKDQCAKLWDLRRLRDASPEATDRYAVEETWDYRWESRAPSASSSAARAADTSLLTFKGHRIQRTLIQAAFTPDATTGGRYVVSGSADGDVVMYDTLAAPTDAGVVRPARRLKLHRDVVRTVALSPSHDLMVSAGWDHRCGLWQSHRVVEEE